MATTGTGTSAPDTGMGGTEGERPSAVSQSWARFLYGLAAVLAIAALVVNVTHPRDWSVDATSVGLIAVLLIIPIAEQLRKLKFGALEAEFAARVATRVGSLEKRVADLGDRAAEPGPTDQIGDETVATAPMFTPHTLRQIVWVDDEPARNRLEIAELEQRFSVVRATSTEAGLAEISKDPGGTAVISAAVRAEAGERNAGEQLLKRVRDAFPGVPVYIYCEPQTVDYGAQLQAAGARLVTDSFTDLARAIRSDARRGFKAEVLKALQAAGNVNAGAQGLDFVVALPDQRIGVEAKNWRRPAAAHAQDLDATVRKFSDLIQTKVIDEGWIVAPRDIFSAAQQHAVPQNVQLLSIDEVARARSRHS